MVSSSQRSGRNSRQSSGQLACSVTALTDTPSWQLAVLPSVPEYWRCTPTEWSPSLGKPVSSTAHAVGSSAATSRSASRRRTGRQSHGEHGHEVVQRLVVHLPPSRCGHRLDRLAPPLQHQPTQVALPAGALILARQRLEDVVGERLQAPADGGQLGWCDAPHPAPLLDRKGGSTHTHPSDANLTEPY